MEALIRIQKELKAPKDKVNNWNAQNTYSYRSAEGIFAAVKPLLGKATLVLTDEVKEVGTRIYIGSTATLKEGTEFESATAWAREQETKKGLEAAQVTGGCSSYARKYAMQGLFLLDDGNDPDSIPAENAPSEDSKWTPTTGPDQQAEPQQPEPEQQSAPATPPAGKTLAPTPEQRPWVKSLWEFYLTQAKGRPMNTKEMHKMMALCMMHMQRYPGSMSDVDLCKRYIKVEELIG